MAMNQKSCSFGYLTCRQVLNIMVILGFMLNYMLRVNLTIAIVAMITPKNDTHEIVYSNKAIQCEDNIPNGTEFKNSDTIEHEDYSKNMPDDGKSREDKMNVPREQTRYPWNEYEKNIVLGSFFWGYVFTELPGGRLSEVVGAKKVFGYSMLISSILTFITPAASSYGYLYLSYLRALLGLMLGVTWPAIQPMTAFWIPPNERSKFISNMMASSLGAALTMPLSGFLIASFGWEYVFYVTGMIGLTWSVAWFLLVFDSPAQHPRITQKERNYIEQSIGSSKSEKRLPVPWSEILTSLPVWAIITTHACSVFGYFTVVNQLPTYMKYILHFDIKENGLLSSLPYLGKYLFALATSVVADHLRKTNKFTVTQIRKFFTLFAVMSPGLLMMVQAIYGCDRAISVFVFTLALTINGGVCAGYLSNGLDLAPNFSGTIFGIANTFSSIGGYLSTYMVGSLTNENQRFSRWSIIFWILAALYCTGAVIFIIFGNGEIQHWNSPTSRKRSEHEFEKDQEAKVPLQEKKIIS